MKALEINDLEKTYKNGVKALNKVSFVVKEKDFFGLLGPNGAGKSTIIGIISGLVNKSHGQVKVFGIDIDKDFDEAKKMIGVVPQEFNFNMFAKVIDIVVDQAGYYGVPRKVAIVRAEKYLKQLGLWEKKDMVSRTLSGGMKRRLMIARGLVHEPKLLILDEPTAGVDVELRRGMWDFLTKLSKNVTIILTTHYLEEAEMLCEHIAIINKGKLVENASKKNLLSKLNQETYILDLEKDIEKVPVVKGYSLSLKDSNTLEVVVTKEQKINDLFELLSKKGIFISSMRNKSNRLEELFVNLTEGNK
ncbi:ABC transporter ATP-binding protein [Candidatus Woesearchaeota archaeon]|jgi:ABC-2 type transport system ATP-binding protein|nr:ABC transporter ATP-binding protein [Candidatus Woesearchaeota archaeon]MBT5740409.1 ABC transporter ATP-binding protein [Candidatus Woesearchaeota archaeon]